jgi:solute:Na+ symporter, SSS family
MDSRLAIDSAVLLLYFVLIISIGLYMGRKEENLKDFALGGRGIPWWAVLASLIAAETSAGTFFGTPGEGFALRNYTYLQLALGTIIARILVSYIFIKPYYDYNVYSIYEYLTARFGVPTKNAASAVFLFTRLLASGTRLYAAAIALALAYEMIRGVQPSQKETLFIYIGSTVAIVILTAVYTTLGGIKAVIWTDFIQASIMIGSALIALGVTLLRNTRWFSSNRSKSRRLRHFGFLHHRFESGHAWMGKMERHVRDRVHNFCRLNWLNLHDYGDARHRSGHGPAHVDRA